MPPVKFNFTGVNIEGFEPWPEDEGIPFIIVKIEEGVSAAGNRKFVFEFKHGSTNRKAWKHQAVPTESLWSFKQLLIDLGVDEGELEEEFEFEPEEFIGTEVELYFGPERSYTASDGQEKKTQDIVGVFAT